MVNNNIIHNSQFIANSFSTYSLALVERQQIFINVDAIQHMAETIPPKPFLCLEEQIKPYMQLILSNKRKSEMLKY
jgi:hypothetical protein